MPPKAEPFDLRCDDPSAPAQCSGECPELPALVADADGTAPFDAVLALAPQDRLVLQACAAKVRACNACIDRGRREGIIR